MSAYGHGKPLRVAPRDIGLWRYGEGANVGKCDICICTLCTGRHCWMRTKKRHCDWCYKTLNHPVIICDYWERKPYKKYKVKRKYVREDFIVDSLKFLMAELTGLKESFVKESEERESGDL